MFQLIENAKQELGFISLVVYLNQPHDNLILLGQYVIDKLCSSAYLLLINHNNSLNLVALSFIKLFSTLKGGADNSIRGNIPISCITTPGSFNHFI